MAIAEMNWLKPRGEDAYDAHRIALQIRCCEVSTNRAPASAAKVLGDAGELALRIRGREVGKAGQIKLVSMFKQKIEFREPVCRGKECGMVLKRSDIAVFTQALPGSQILEFLRVDQGGSAPASKMALRKATDGSG